MQKLPLPLDLSVAVTKTLNIKSGGCGGGWGGGGGGDQLDPVIRQPSRPLIREQIALAPTRGNAFVAIPLILPDETRVKRPTDKYGRSICEKYPNISPLGIYPHSTHWVNNTNGKNTSTISD